VSGSTRKAVLLGMLDGRGHCCGTTCRRRFCSVQGLLVCERFRRCDFSHPKSLSRNPVASTSLKATISETTNPNSTAREISTRSGFQRNQSITSIMPSTTGHGYTLRVGALPPSSMGRSSSLARWRSSQRLQRRSENSSNDSISGVSVLTLSDMTTASIGLSMSTSQLDTVTLD
jgi:hypothetical protein